MHLHNRTSALGLALSFTLFLSLVPTAFAAPTQQDPAELQNDTRALLDTCCETVDAVEAELEAERLAAIEAAKPESVRRAEAELGKPYGSGGAGPGFYDCSGLVSYCLTGQHGHAYTSYAFWNMPAVSDPQPGDVVACSPGHVGLYIGDGMMIHAPQSGEYVRVEAIRGKVVRP